MMSSPATLADRLNTARRLRGLTQEQLADIARIPQAQVSRIERGKVADPGFATVVALADALGLSLAALAAPTGDQLLSELAAPVNADTVLFGVAALNDSPVRLVRGRGECPHLAVCGAPSAGRRYAAKLELVRQRLAGRPVTVIDPAGEFTGLAEPHELVRVSAGADRVPLLVPPPGCSVGDHTRWLVPWLLSLTDVDDHGSPYARELLAQALGRAYGTFRLAVDATVTPGTACPDLEHLLASLRAGGTWASGPLTEQAASIADALQAQLGSEEPLRLVGGSVRRAGDVQVWDLSGVSDPRLRAHLSALAFHQVCWAAVDAADGRAVCVDIEPLMVTVAELLDTLDAAANSVRKYGLALTFVLPADSGALAAARNLFAQSGAALLMRSDQAAVEALASVFDLSNRERTRLLDAASGEGLLIRQGERGWVRVAGTASPAEHERVTAARPPLPDLPLQLLKFPFPGYGGSTGKAWAVHDGAGRVLVVDAPDSEGTSVANAEGVVLGPIRELTRVDPKAVWVLTSYDGVWPVDLTLGQFARDRGLSDVFVTAARRLLHDAGISYA